MATKLEMDWDYWPDEHGEFLVSSPYVIREYAYAVGVWQLTGPGLHVCSSDVEWLKQEARRHRNQERPGLPDSYQPEETAGTRREASDPSMYTVELQELRRSARSINRIVRSSNIYRDPVILRSRSDLERVRDICQEILDRLP